MAGAPLTEDWRAWLELIRTLMVPMVGWVAMELRAMRLKLTELEMWTKGHDTRDDERFDGHNQRLNRHEDRLGQIERHRRN